MENFQDLHEHDQELALDRKQIAVDLRRLGADIDFEDWDGLDDNDVLGNIATLAAMHGYDIEDVLVTVAPVEIFKENNDEV